MIGGRRDTVRCAVVVTEAGDVGLQLVDDDLPMGWMILSAGEARELSDALAVGADAADIDADRAPGELGRFLVTMATHGTCAVEVEATSAVEAVELAEGEMPSLCHDCERDGHSLGDPTPVAVRRP